MQEQTKATTSTIQLQTISYNSLKIGTLLGNGGYGDVYKATWHGTEVAIKELHLKTLSKALQDEFNHESQMMAQCQFPHIIGLYGVCDEIGHKGFVMEYMPKGSLRAVLEDKSEELSWDIRWPIAIDIGKGLTYLHEKNILHRDLKSLNVLLGADYHAKICDFGLSKIKLETSSSNTKSNKGTVRWRAPETFKRGFKPVSSSDIYSYGMVLWEIAARELPFADAQDEITAMGWIKDGEKETIPTDSPKAYGKVIEETWEEAEKRPTAEKIVATLSQAKPEVTLKISEKSLKSPKIHVEKSWHFDPATERKVSQDSVEPYQILDSTEKDKQKVISFYQHHPVQGYEIGSVKVIYNRDFNHEFQLRIKKLQHKDNNPGFAPKWNQENSAPWRAETNQKFEDLAKPYKDPEYPAVKILPLWHGTKRGILDSIFRTGYANLATTDSGFFGKGLYGAHEAEYSYRVYGPGANPTDGVLILNWVASSSAYPVIDGDMSKLTGKGNYQNYDAHFVPVVPQNPNNSNEVNYFPCKPNQKNAYTELVTFESASCLPRYLVELQLSGPQHSLKTPKIEILQLIKPVTIPQIILHKTVNNLPQSQDAMNKTPITKTTTNLQVISDKIIIRTPETFGSSANYFPSESNLTVISPPQQEIQNKLVDAILKGNIELVKNVELQGASFLHPNEDGIFPLAAAVYSINLKLIKYIENQLKEDITEQWKKVEAKKFKKFFDKQMPDLLSENPTYSELRNWYIKYQSAQWCKLYDQKIGGRWYWGSEWCKRVNTHERNSGAQNTINMALKQGEWFESYGRNGVNFDGSTIYVPSVKAHESAVAAVREELNESRKYIKPKIKQEKMAGLESKEQQLKEKEIRLIELESKLKMQQLEQKEKFLEQQKIMQQELTHYQPNTNFFMSKPKFNQPMDIQQLEKQNELTKALLSGNFELVKTLEKQGASFLYPDKDGCYPLVAAVYSCKWELIIYVEEKLAGNVLEYWEKVDIKEFAQKLDSQMPTPMPENLTREILENWYKKHNSPMWRNAYESVKKNYNIDNRLRWGSLLSLQTEEKKGYGGNNRFNKSDYENMIPQGGIIIDNEVNKREVCIYSLRPSQEEYAKMNEANRSFYQKCSHLASNTYTQEEWDRYCGSTQYYKKIVKETYIKYTIFFAPNLEAHKNVIKAIREQLNELKNYVEFKADKQATITNKF